MLDWLVEERFVRRCGPDEHFTPRWADGMMDENEAWDDTVPNWATSAHLTQGVSWEPNQPGRNLQRNNQALTVHLRLASQGPRPCNRQVAGSNP